MIFAQNAFAQPAAAGTGSSAGGMLVLLPMYALIFFFFYILMIRPQQKKQKQQQDMIANLKKNDEVVTVGGMFGTVQAVKDSSVVLRVDDSTRIEFQKQAIAAVVKSRT